MAKYIQYICQPYVVLGYDAINKSFTPVSAVVDLGGNTVITCYSEIPVVWVWQEENFISASQIPSNMKAEGYNMEIVGAHYGNIGLLICHGMDKNHTMFLANSLIKIRGLLKCTKILVIAL